MKYWQSGQVILNHIYTMKAAVHTPHRMSSPHLEFHESLVAFPLLKDAVGFGFLR